LSDGLRPKKLLVTGAGGFVGRVVCAEAASRGLQVIAAVRSEAGIVTGGSAVAIGEIDGQTDWSAALGGVDVIIHLAARAHVMREGDADPLTLYRRINLYGTQNLAEQAVRAGVKRLVYVSSIKVNGEATSARESFSEQSAPEPEDPYGISKWEAEQALLRIARDSGLEVVIVRPPLVYGDGVKGNFAQMLKVLAKGIPLPLASVQNLRSLVFVKNLADALLLCASHPLAAGQTYLVSDGEDISTPGLLRGLSAASGGRARLYPFPLALLHLAGRLVGKAGQVERLTGSLRVDSGKIRRELNWTPPYTLQQGLQATAEWYRNAHL
jgi:nucleoside-diphosphate-sugar epimerase